MAITRAIEERIGKRRGERTDLGDTRNLLPAYGPEVKPGDEIRDIAAAKAGFVSKGSYRRAAIVVDKGIPELVEAMDSGAASVSAAAKVANLGDGQNKPKADGSAVPIGTACISAPEASEMLNVGLRSTKRARSVLVDAIPDIVAAAKRDEISVSHAPLGEERRLAFEVGLAGRGGLGLAAGVVGLGRLDDGLGPAVLGGLLCDRVEVGGDLGGGGDGDLLAVHRLN